MTTIELDARKVQLTREILNVDSIEVLDKLQKAFNRVISKANTSKEDDVEYISKEEILAGIDAGLKDLKAGRKTSAREFLNELRNEI